MGREQRVHIKGATYHIIARGNNRQEIFIKQSDGEKYLSLLRQYRDKFSFKLYAYVLMSNHVHLLMRVNDYTLSQIMQGIQQSYAKYFNNKYKRVGHVFQGRYMSKICINDEYLFTLLRYIHQNPVRAGITETPDYRWSSHNCYVKGYSDLVDVDYILSIISANKQQAIQKYAQLVQVAVEKGDVEPAFSSSRDEEPQDPEQEEIPGLSMETLLEVVGTDTGVDAEQLMSASRARKVVAARNLVIFLAVNNGVAKRSELAEMFDVSLSRVSRGYYTILENEELRKDAERIMNLLKAMKQA